MGHKVDIPNIAVWSIIQLIMFVRPFRLGFGLARPGVAHLLPPWPLGCAALGANGGCLALYTAGLPAFTYLMAFRVVPESLLYLRTFQV